VLRFDFINLEPDGHKGETLVRKGSGPAFIIVNFQSQHVFEPAFLETTVLQPLPASLPVGSRLAGPSRVALALPDNVDVVPLSLEGLLEVFGKLEMHVALNALPPGKRDAVAQAPLLVLSLNFDPPSPTHGKLSRAARLLRHQRAAFAR